MALSFFRALNPLSPDSGIEKNNVELIDKPLNQKNLKIFTYAILPKSIQSRISDAHAINAFGFEGWFVSLLVTGLLFYGFRDLTDRDENRYKGLLDLLIFPLVSRKLIADTYLEERANSPILNVLAWTAAIPLEILRFAIALTLFIAAFPIVTLTHLIGACIPEKQKNEDVLPLDLKGIRL